MNRLKLIQPPCWIFGFCKFFCLFQSKQTFVKSSHLLGLLTFRVFDKKKRFLSKFMRQICRGVATLTISKSFFLFRGCDNSTALELKQVAQLINGRENLKNLFMCKRNVIRTSHLFYRHNTTWKNIDAETAIDTLTCFFN